MGSKNIRNWFLIVIVLLMTSACSAVTQVTPTSLNSTQFVLQPTIQPSATVTPASATITPSAAPTTQPATATIPAAVTSLPTAIALVMKSGQTELTANDSLDQNHQPVYLIAAKSGQYLMVSINSTNPVIGLEIQAPDGSLLVKSSAQLANWQGILPLDGTYKLSLSSKDPTGSYNLNIVIPVQVKFAAGATSTSFDGSVSAHQINTYMIKAEKNQTLAVNIDSPGKDIFLTIYGLQDGQPYLRSEMGSTSASIKLPSTQDYVIQCVSQSDSDENYKIIFQAK